MVDKSILLRTWIAGHFQKTVVERTQSGITSWIEIELAAFANMKAAFRDSASVLRINVFHLFILNKYRFI